jgi:glycosyltransferase involved in cell wall biosynthesis
MSKESSRVTCAGKLTSELRALRRCRILYLTFDGVLDPLGQSQVVRYLCRLSDRGFSYSLISLERESNLVNAKVLSETEELLRRHAIEWIRLPYHIGGPKAVLRNIREMARSARGLIRTRDIGLVHARAYVPAFIARYLQLRCGTSYLFDARGYWIDEKAAEGQWFTRPGVYAGAKWLERRLFQSAVAIVTLTAVMADDLRTGILRNKQQIPIAVIPTCADFDHFSPASRTPSAVPTELRLRLEGKLVVGMMGAINASYCVREGLVLFRMLRERRADAHLLCVTQQVALARALIRGVGISEDDCTITQSSYQDMPDWMRWMDWGLLLLNETFAKRGSMPTKLAEMMACGVRPVQYGCNQEVADRVHKAGSGIALTDLSLSTLAQCAEQIAITPLLSDVVRRARDESCSWFGIESGINKYESLLTQILMSKDHLVH